MEDEAVDLRGARDVEIEVFWGPRLPTPRPSSASAQSGNIRRVKSVHIFVRGDGMQNPFLVDLRPKERQARGKGSYRLTRRGGLGVGKSAKNKNIEFVGRVLDFDRRK